MEPKRLEEALESLSELKELVKGNERAEQLIRRIEAVLSDKEGIALDTLRALSQGGSEKELAELAKKMREDSSVRQLINMAYGVPSRFADMLFWAWVIAAGIFFIMGIYFFFPPYVFFSEMSGNTTIVQRTLEVIYTRPDILRAADFLFKLLGLLMLVMALASMYQAHAILERRRGPRS